MENAAQVVRKDAGDVGLLSGVANKRGKPVFFIISRENKSKQMI